MELQRTFDGQLVPTADLPDDEIVTECGARMRRADCFVDCKGRYYADDYDRHEADAELVHDAIDAHCQCIEEYTEHDDYADAYVHCALESACHDGYARDDLIEFIKDYGEEELRDGEAEKIADDILGNLQGWDVECEHQCSEYASYSGAGVCVWSCAVGEVEGQMDIAEYEWADVDDLELIFEEYRGYASLYEWTTYNKETQRREGNGYLSRGVLTYYANPGGAWHFVIPAESIRDKVNEYLESCEDDSE